MATIVSHGYMAQLSDQMHPFFRHAHVSKPQTPTPLEVPSAASTTAMNYDPDNDHNSSPTFLSSDGEWESKAKNDVESFDAEADPNSDRRKRRKTTPSPQDDGLTTAVKIKSHMEAWRKQLEEAADCAELPSLNPASSVGSRSKPIDRTTILQPPTSANIQDFEDSVASKGRVPGIEAEPDSGEHCLAQIDGNQSPPRKAPRKQMLQLTSKGKLIKSPPQVRKSKRQCIVSLTSATALGIQQGRLAGSKKIAVSYKRNNDETRETAEKIEKILKGQIRMPAPNSISLPTEIEKKHRNKPKRPTHPFFTGKAALKAQVVAQSSVTDGQSTRETSTEASTTHAKQPVPWSEIKFSTRKISASRDIENLQPIWPPRTFQHLRPAEPDTNFAWSSRVAKPGAKRKQELIQVTEDEDVFGSYKLRLPTISGGSSKIQLPARLHMDATELMNTIDEDRQSQFLSSGAQIPLQRIRARAFTSRSAFEQGKAAGPQDWTHAFSPKRQDEVLQPQSKILLEWLSKIEVNQVQSKLSSKTEREDGKRTARKRKLKRNDLDDFIAGSDDEEGKVKSNTKNVIVLAGPSGCGKTASVYAVAQELDYEVFEVHSGMRRTARDIFDKVGDMSLNHLVQPSTVMTRESSTLTDSTVQSLVKEDFSSGNQQTTSSFLDGRKKDSAPAATPPLEKAKSQKQSLILFEEVDVLFDDDKTFWSGVQTLAQQSKRPIVLTCNNLETVPLDELDVFATLHFDRPSVADAVEYLAYVAAAEGHILDRNDLATLFVSRGQDLRASMTELNFWCQMTVGSDLGGLDWMHHAPFRSTQSRIISKGTFYDGLNLLPESNLSSEDLLIHAEESLGVSPLDWEDMQNQSAVKGAEGYNPAKSLRDFSHLAEVKSCVDLMNVQGSSSLSTAASSAFPEIRKQPIPADLTISLLAKANEPWLSNKNFIDIFEPLMEDCRTFPPSTGRAAASLDGSGQHVATEIAPFVRYIVAFDERLEEQRNELAGGSQSIRQRRTRAARAALEGGDKANTRRERWFPKDLNFEQVRNTLPCSELQDQACELFSQGHGLLSPQTHHSEGD